MDKVAIIGAGPAGLFAAYQLAGKAEVTVYDKGKTVEKRNCPSPDNCKQCKLCVINYGEGGAGLKADGKIIFDTFVGNRLYDFIPHSKNKQLVEEVKKIFGNYGVKPKSLDQKALEEIEKIETEAAVAGIRFVPTKELAHVGTDYLPTLIASIRDDIKARGAEFLTKTDVLDLDVKTDGFDIHTKQGKNKDTRHFDKVFIAPGRTGAEWLESVIEKYGIAFNYAPMDLGVRIETKKGITARVTDLVRDMKFYIETPNGDMVRTFCTCPGGEVTREYHEKGYVLVNGHSKSGDMHENTNFAMLVSVPFTEPQANGNLIARRVARTINGCGENKPILTRLGDLRKNRRSKKKHEGKYYIKPSLEDVVFGDINFLPGRITNDLIYAIDKLDQILPGLAGDGTLMYAPETKFQSIKVKTDQYLQTNVPNIYVGGDGAGLSSGIVGAAACGVLAAEGILKG